MITNKTVYQGYKAVTTNGKAEYQVFGDGFAPYDYLLAALSSCFYDTFLNVLEKKKLTPEKVEITATGQKREEVPSTLEWTDLKIVVFGDLDQNQIEKAADLAAKYCSIHETISKVSKMTHSVEIIRK